VAKRKRPLLSDRKRSNAGRAGVARAVANHKRASDADTAEAAAKAKRERERREKMTFLLDPDLAAELRAASTELPPKVFGATLSSMVGRAVLNELEKLRRQWNHGERFDTSGQVQTRKGRPPKR